MQKPGGQREYVPCRKPKVQYAELAGTRRMKGVGMRDDGKEKIRAQIANVPSHHLDNVGNYSEGLSCEIIELYDLIFM